MDFCFASYVLKISPCFLVSYSQEDVINILLRFYIVEANIIGKTGEALDIDKTTASRLINQLINLPRVIRKALKNPKTTDNFLIDYFKKKIIPELNPNKIESLSGDIGKMIKESNEINLENKEKLSLYLEEKKYAEFLAISLKYTLCINNRKESILKSDEELNKKAKSEVKKTNPKIIVPEEIQAEEQPYISAIIDAISEKEKQSLTIENLKDIKKYEDKLTHHRTEYFSAEYVRRQSREIYDENDDPFDELQDELKDGIYYTINKEYENGYDRLNSSLEQAAQVQIESNPLVKETNLVNMKAKQGLCHTLINDKKLDGWTNDKYN